MTFQGTAVLATLSTKQNQRTSECRLKMRETWKVLVESNGDGNDVDDDNNKEKERERIGNKCYDENVIKTKDVIKTVIDTN